MARDFSQDLVLSLVTAALFPRYLYLLDRSGDTSSHGLKSVYKLEQSGSLRQQKESEQFANPHLGEHPDIYLKCKSQQRHAKPGGYSRNTHSRTAAGRDLLQAIRLVISLK
jgi:hypothetical protein